MPQRPITGFIKAYGIDAQLQSISMPAAARFLRDIRNSDVERVVIRGAGKGGRPLIGRIKNGRPLDGIYKDSYGDHSFIFRNLIQQARNIIDVARTTRQPISHTYFPFFHGEADRSTVGTEYVRNLTSLMNEVDAALDVPTTWLLTQPSGTAPSHGGNAWANRTAVKDIADTRSNAALACANYAYPLFDAAHLDATSKALIGELIGGQAAAIANGKTIPVIRPETVVVNNKVIEVSFSGMPQLELDDMRFPPPRATLGFHIHGLPFDFVQNVAVVAADKIRITCAQTLPAAFTLNYAYAARRKTDPSEDTRYPYGRGCLRETWLGASLVAPGQQLLKWVPAFSVSVVNDGALQPVPFFAETQTA